jgi:hypothetical protein
MPLNDCLSLTMSTLSEQNLLNSLPGDFETVAERMDLGRYFDFSLRPGGHEQRTHRAQARTLPCPFFFHLSPRTASDFHGLRFSGLEKTPGIRFWDVLGLIPHAHYRIASTLERLVFSRLRRKA